MQDLPEFTGGCQCGAVRYRVSAGPGKANLCFCDMCRRATGSPVPSFISVPRDRVTWSGTPAVFASSDIATRGFCRDCGTPLYYAGNHSTTWGLAAGTADITVSPDVVFYFEKHPDWLGTLATLPKPDFDPATCSGDADPNA
ncbi:MAG: GFA family protein [Paracoccaceae bacterium]